jgi:hypothetical protein
MGGKALVPQVNGQAGERAQFSGEELDLFSLRALLAGEAQRIADDDSGDGVATAEACQGAEVVPPIAMTFQGQDGLRREAQLVGDSDTDAAVAYVEREITRMRSGFQIRLLALSLTGNGGWNES